MLSDLAARAANNLGLDRYGKEVFGDINGSDIEKYHRAVFEHEGLGADVWTAETPYRLFGEAGWQMMMRDGEIRGSMEMFFRAGSAALGLGELIAAGTATPQDQRDFVDLERWMGTVETLEAGTVGRDVMGSFKGFDAMNLGFFVPSALEGPGGFLADARVRQAAARLLDVDPADGVPDEAGAAAGPLRFAADHGAGSSWPAGAADPGASGAMARFDPPFSFATGLAALLDTPRLTPGIVPAGPSALPGWAPDGAEARMPPFGGDGAAPGPRDPLRLRAAADLVFGPPGSPGRPTGSGLFPADLVAEAGESDETAMPSPVARAMRGGAGFGTALPGENALRRPAFGPTAFDHPSFGRHLDDARSEPAADRRSPTMAGDQSWPVPAGGGAASPSSGGMAQPDGGGALLATLSIDDLTLDRIVRGYIDRACSGGPNGSQRPDPTLRLMPAGSRGY